MTTEGRLPVGVSGEFLSTSIVTDSEGVKTHREAVVITDPDALDARANVRAAAAVHSVNDYAALAMPPFIQSSVNTTTTPLGSGETYTGTFEQNGLPDVMVSCQTDNSGTLYFDFSVDGTNVTTFPVSGFSVSSGVHEFHTAVKGPRFFRVRFVNDTGAQSYLRLYTYYGVTRQGNAPIGFTIASDADALVTKSVLSGVGDATARVTDHQALQVTLPPDGKTAFGELIAVEPSPIVQITFPYNVNTNLVDLYQNQSGTVTQSGRQVVMSSGAAQNSSGALRSKKSVKYVAGEGVLCRFTSVFTTGVAGSTQISGIGNESDGLFFGYNGTSFGILHRKNGSPEIRTLTVTTGSSDAENITITLDGVAKTDVAVTNTGNTTLTAAEIAAADYSDVGPGWAAYAVGAKVEFKSWDAATHTGTYSLSSATSAVGTFAQNVAGAAPDDTWTAQENWNGDDKFDGSGITGVTLDPTNGNVYQIKYQWLGYGLLSFFVEDPADGELHLVHAIPYANTYTTPSMGDASLPFMSEAKNTTNNTALTVSVASFAIFVEGKLSDIGDNHNVRNVKSTVTTALLPIISVRQGTHLNSKAVASFTRIIRATMSVEHTKPIQIVVIRGGTLTGAVWVDVDSGNSSVQYDVSATAITGGKEQFSIPLGKSGNDNVSFLDDYYANILSAGEVMTAAAIAISGTGGDAAVALNIRERL